MADAAETFGHRVHQRRAALGWPLRTLREKCGVAISQLNRVEHGKGTSLMAAVTIADALGCPLALLLVPVECECCGDCPPPGMACMECDRDCPWWGNV